MTSWSLRQSPLSHPDLVSEITEQAPPCGNASTRSLDPRYNHTSAVEPTSDKPVIRIVLPRSKPRLPIIYLRLALLVVVCLRQLSGCFRVHEPLIVPPRPPSEAQPSSFALAITARGRDSTSGETSDTLISYSLTLIPLKQCKPLYIRIFALFRPHQANRTYLDRILNIIQSASSTALSRWAHQI